MNLVQRYKSILKTAIVAFVAGLFLFTPVAAASNISTPSLPITNGSFMKREPINFPTPVTVKSAVVTLTPEDEAGIVNITIQQGGRKTFDCTAYAVRTNDDLISKCNEGDAVVGGEPGGELTVSGSGFSPSQGLIKVEFSVQS